MVKWTKQYRQAYRRQYHEQNKAHENAINRSWYARNKERAAAKQREYQQRPEVRERKKVWSRNYKLRHPWKTRRIWREAQWRRQGIRITEKEYFAKRRAQDRRCAICHRRVEKLDVDHKHGTGQIRGLLCTRCNAMIGSAMESTKILQEAIRYLEYYEGLVHGATNPWPIASSTISE